MPRRIDTDEIELVRLYLSGMSAQKVADRLKYSKRSVLRVLRKRGVPRRHWAGPLNASYREKDLLRRMYEEERQTMTMIAEKLGASVGTIHRWIHKYGFERRRRAVGDEYQHPTTRYVYVFLPDHPCSNRGYVKRADLVMERKIGRALYPGEVVHHVGERDDDSTEMLVLCSSESDHQKRFHRKCSKAGR